MGVPNVMTYPPQQPGPGGPQGPYGPQGQPNPYGQQPGVPQGPPQYGQPGQQPYDPYSQPAQPPYGQPQQPGQPGPYGQPVPGYGQPGEWGQQPYGPPPQGQPPYGMPPAGFGQPGGYGVPPGKKSPLPWILAGGGVLVVVAIVAVFLLTLGGGVGGGDARSVAQAYANAINDKKENTSLYCDAFRQKAEDAADDLPGGMPTEIPELPDMTFKASVGEVTESGDTATAKITVDAEFEGQKVSTSHSLELRKESGDWKICDVKFDL